MGVIKAEYGKIANIRSVSFGKVLSLESSPCASESSTLDTPRSDEKATVEEKPSQGQEGSRFRQDCSRVPACLIHCTWDSSSCCCVRGQHRVGGVDAMCERERLGLSNAK